MEYIACNRLDNSIITQLEEDSIHNDYEPFFATSINGTFMHFHLLMSDNRVVSFIGIMPISETSVEITGYTRKAYRHQGHFSFLLKHVLTELSHSAVTEILTDCMLDFPFAKCVPAHSEYLMLLKKDHFVPTANTADTEILEYCDSYESCKEYTYVLQKDSQPIGLLKITLEETSATSCLHHVQIRKSKRQSGYGKRLLAGALHMFFEENDCDILLHVTGTNIPAVTLYQKTGFRIIQSLDYYHLHLAEQ